MEITIRHLDWMEFIWTSTLPTHAKYLAAYLSRYMNKDKDVAWPGKERMAHETGISKRSVDKYISLLITEGFMLCEARNKGGRTKANRYTFAIPDNIIDRINGALYAPLNTKTVQLMQERVQMVQVRGAGGAPESSIESSKNHSGDKSRIQNPAHPSFHEYQPPEDNPAAVARGVKEMTDLLNTKAGINSS